MNRTCEHNRIRLEFSRFEKRLRKSPRLPAIRFPIMNRMENTVLAGFAILVSFSYGCATKQQPEMEGMLFIDGGEFSMGTNDGLPFEGSAHRVVVDSFFMDIHEVTNAQFAAFADATGYVTESERLGWSGVFDPGRSDWTVGVGADWRRPNGPGSSHEEMEDYPAVHLSWDDAVSYCKWRGGRLPTEAEFEYAALADRK